MSETLDKLSGLSLAQKRALAARLLRRKAGRSVSFHALSYNQQAMWIEHQRAPTSAAYNVSFAARLSGEVDVARLRRAFQSLVDRHSSLRTTFTTQGEKVVQQINPQQEVCFTETDGSAWSAEELQTRLSAEALRPFNLRDDSLFRINLFAESSGNSILLLTVHHIIGDFWSLIILLDELEILYAGEPDVSSPSLPPAQYIDYSEWQARLLAGTDGERLWSYWQQQLSGELPVLELLTDRSRPAAQSYRADSLLFVLNNELTERLKALAKSEKTTLYVVLLAALKTLLYRYTGRENILVGSPLIGRNRPEFRDVVGNFINPVVMRTALWGISSSANFCPSCERPFLWLLSTRSIHFLCWSSNCDQCATPAVTRYFRSCLCSRSRISQRGKGHPCFLWAMPGRLEPGQHHAGVDQLQTTES